MLEALREKRVLKGMPVERVTFNAITKDAVQAALRNPRQIDQALVDAYLAPPRPRLSRRLHPLAGAVAQAAGRALRRTRPVGGASPRLRPRTRDRDLQAAEYWSLIATLATKDGGVFDARLVGADGKKIQRLDIGNGEEPEAFKQRSRARDLLGREYRGQARQAPPLPALHDLDPAAGGLAQARPRPAQTMRIAQRLYEGVDIGGETVGLITYMRTDGVDMAPEAVQAARRVIGREYGDRYVPGVPRKYTTKAKNAQEAHEAIRPTDMGRLPKYVAQVSRSPSRPGSTN